MAEPKDILRYLRECYRENGSRGGIWNFFGNSVQNRVFVEDRDLVVDDSAGGRSHYLRNQDAEVAAEKAFVYRKERDLIYGTIFVTGWVERFEGKPETVCAPIFIFPGTLTREGYEFGAKLEIDLSARQINYALLEAIGGENLVRTIEEAIEQVALTEGCVGQVRTIFDELIPETNGKALLSYPNLISEAGLRKKFKAAGKDAAMPLRLEPAAAIALVNKSTQMRGVLNELEEMAEPGTKLSPPLRSLLGGTPVPVAAAKSGRVPAVLSASQQEILESARRNPLTLAIGPPGTGKSFTIATLAIETLSRGGTVLIASKMDHAVDVVGAKIETTIGLDGVVVRGGRKEYLKDLKRFMGELLNGVHTAGAPEKREVTLKDRSLTDRESQIERLRLKLAGQLAEELRWGELLSLPPTGWFRRLRQRWTRRSVQKQDPVWETAGSLERLIDLQLIETVTYLEMARMSRLAGHLKKGSRTTFQDFLKALRARTGSRQVAYFEKILFADLLSALPIWLVNLSDVHRILPLTESTFDLAIIDEATQCDMASALPVLQRARRAVIAGDPKQLRHLSFLPLARLQALAEQFGLDEEQRQQFNFRDVSLLDLVSDRIGDQSQVAFLNEHFRSRPEIIDFSNREFYGGRLHIMTSHRKSEGAPGNALQLQRIEGTRGEGGVNVEEAKAIMEGISAIGEGQSSLSGNAVHSIGILSPFRDQVEYLQKILGGNGGNANLMQRHDVLIGTAHSFQGEERDLMFLSLVVDNQSPAASFRFLEKPDVFNVAVTRARLLNHVFHSFDPGQLKADSLLMRYLAHAAEVTKNAGMPHGDSETNHASPIHDRFASEVAELLQCCGADVTLGYPLAGMEVDLIYTIGGETRGIDLVGFPGALADSFPLERVLTFRRAGLQILPLPYTAWVCRREECEAWLTGKPKPGEAQRNATNTRT